MKLLIPAEILKAATVYTNKDKTRYNINCLLFEDGKVIATNGHSLLVWRHGVILDAEQERIMTKGKEEIEIRSKETPDFLMSFDKTSLKFLKAANKGVLAFHYDTETRVLSDGYGQSITLHEPPLKGDFPEWRKSTPNVQDLKPIAHCIGTEIIETFAEYAKARKGRGNHGFTVLTASVGHAFYLMPRDFTDCFIIAMPMNGGQSLEEHLETIKAVSGAVAEVTEEVAA